MNEPVPTASTRPSESARPAVRSVLSERYAVLGELAAGGMGSVLYGRLRGPVGFARAVAIKRMHPHLACEPDFVSMFIDEARICARLSHVNIVPTLDVIEEPTELCLVMEYVHGASLDVLLDVSWQRGFQVPVRIAVALIVAMLHGLHAAHEARDDNGESLCVVHRDVSPHNALVGEDGVLRVLDFGIAKATGKLRTTPSGEVKGKLAYMAPEQFRGLPADRRVDVRGAAAVLWETLSGHPLYEGDDESAIVYRVLHDPLVPPSRARPRQDDPISAELDAIVLRGLARNPDERFASAREMALALERAVQGASQFELSEWVRMLVGPQLDARAAELRKLQQLHDRGSEADAAARGARERDDPSARPASAPPASAPTALAPPASGQPAPTATLIASVSRGASGSPGPRRAWVVLTVLSVLALALALAYLSMRSPAVSHTARRGPEDAQPVVLRAAESAVAPPRATLEADAGTRTADVSSASAAAPSEQEVARDDAGVSAQQTEDPARAARRPSARPGRRELAAPPAAASCSPPYWWSADGVKHYKRECL